MPHRVPARLIVLAERVFGSRAKARRWLRKPSVLLDGEIPLALLANETGERRIVEALHRIDHGMLA